jgi:uncharacterized protein YgiM (DUF1202 family)
MAATKVPTATQAAQRVNDDSRVRLCQVATGGPSLNVRKYQGIQEEVIGGLFEGQIVELLHVGEDWHQIRLEDGKIGYIAARWCNILR